MIPNATHLQQPIDQHCGVTIKNEAKRLFWNYSESVMDDIASGELPSDYKVDTKLKRERMEVKTVMQVLYIKMAVHDRDWKTLKSLLLNKRRNKLYILFCIFMMF